MLVTEKALAGICLRRVLLVSMALICFINAPVIYARVMVLGIS
jgi:hypothetical protein